MAHRIDQEVEVVKGEKFTIICVLPENNCESFDWEDSSENVEILAKQEVSLHDDSVRAKMIERGILLHRPIVWFGVVIEYLSQTFLNFILLEQHWFVYFGN